MKLPAEISPAVMASLAAFLVLASLAVWGSVMRAQRDAARQQLQDLRLAAKAQQLALERAQLDIRRIDQAAAQRLQQIQASLPSTDDPEALRVWALGQRR